MHTIKKRKDKIIKIKVKTPKIPLLKKETISIAKNDKTNKITSSELEKLSGSFGLS